jgi:hypothetical protein
MHTYFTRILALVSTAMLMVVSAHPAVHSRGNDDERTAAVSYYDDARGVFALKAPPSVSGPRLRMTGTCSLPELSLKVRNTSARLPARQTAYRTGGKGSFDFSYVLKDGPGDYEVIVFGKKNINDLEMRGLCAFTVRSTARSPEKSEVPDINRCVLSYVNSVMGTTVGRGECWDLAQEALDGCGADWDRPWKFGALLDPSKDEIRPGDIIQFRTVKLLEQLPDGGSRWQVIGMPDHTAVIIAVLGPLRYRLAHQNINGKRSVITTEVNLNQATAGKYGIYRPVAGIVK